MYTPFGPKLMGDVQIGDVVSTPDGVGASILAIYPQGEVDIYKITFADGRTAEACGSIFGKYTISIGVVNTRR